MVPVMRMRFPAAPLIASALAFSLVLCLAGCEKKPARKPILKWVDLLTSDMNAWSRDGSGAANDACGQEPLTPEHFQACLQEKVPGELRTRSWSIPLHAEPSKQSKTLGEIRITGKVLGGFSMEYVAPDRAAVPFEPDAYLDYSDSTVCNHTVLEEKAGWVLLPKRPFATEVWMEAGQEHAVADVGGGVYGWGKESIVILEVTETGAVARQEIPSDMPCGDEEEEQEPAQIKKFSIPWKELFDKNGHLRLLQKYTIC
jgi:hypothetical protein